MYNVPALHGLSLKCILWRAPPPSVFFQNVVLSGRPSDCVKTYVLAQPLTWRRLWWQWRWWWWRWVWMVWPLGCIVFPSVYACHWQRYHYHQFYRLRCMATAITIIIVTIVIVKLQLMSLPWLPDNCARSLWALNSKRMAYYSYVPWRESLVAFMAYRLFCHFGYFTFFFVFFPAFKTRH